MTIHRLSLSLLSVVFLNLLGTPFPGSAKDAVPAHQFQIPASDEGLPGAGPIRRYAWFEKLWQKRRGTWSQEIQQDQQSLVFLGDSITQGWKSDMGGSFGDVKVANRGISGDTTRGVLIRLKEDVLSLNPSGVVILIGTNDLEEGASAEVITGNLKLIIAALKKHNPNMPIILCDVFPSSESKKRPADQIKKINQLYAAAIKGDPQITRLDTWALFADENGNAKKEEFPDLLHPNQIGYHKWAAALRPILATHDFLETQADDFTPEPGFTALFNGKDLTGWGFHATAKVAKPKKTNPKRPVRPLIKVDIAFDGKTSSNDGRYVAKNGRLIVTTPAEGRRIQQLWTTREFPNNFILKLEFRATPNADSGIFIRKPQLQCRDFPLAGPYKDLKNYKAQDWNEMVITVKDGLAHCTCNGEVIEAALKVPATGPIGFEGDRGQMEYRRIRLKELP